MRSYSRETLQKMAEKKGFAQCNKQIEDARCEADLMYAIFKRPDTVLPTLLPGLVEIIKKKNSPDLEKSRMFRDAMEFLLKNPNADSRLRIFFTLWIINREQEAKDIIRKAYLVEHPGNLWETKCHTHFDRFTHHLAELCKCVQIESFGAGNIIKVIRTTVLCAEQLYLTK